MTSLTSTQQELIRNRPQQTQLFLSIFQPTTIFQAQINDVDIERGARTITYDNASGTYTNIEEGFTLWVGTTPGAQDKGKIRIRSATSSTLLVSENSNIDWANDLYLTVLRYVELWPIFPRIIQNPSNDEDVIFYKDYDLAYTNQNSILGTYVCAGPHRAAYLEGGSTQLFWSSTGTYNLLEDSLAYQWTFEGGTPTGSLSANPGYVTYNSPGHYVTRLIVSGSNGAIDTTYRYVSIYNDANPSIQKWQLQSLNGSRDEGGYTASFKVFQTIPIQEHAVVVIFAKNWYGSTQQDIGGNYPNGERIFWVGYVDKDSIRYDYQHSEMEFDAHSITQMMKESSGFSVSVESVASPDTWYRLLDMDGRRAIYHYLRWHTTALKIADFQFVGDDYKIQFFDSDRGSMFDAIDNFMRDTLWGKTVSDRQGKTWMEVEALAYTNPTGSFPSTMLLTNRDWRGEPTIEEALSESLSFIEIGGIAYSGVVTGTFSALLASAPGNAPGFHGAIQTHEGLALLGQDQVNQLAGNILANENSVFPTVSMDMAINASNIDIAPQESAQLLILASDTVRNIPINGLYLPKDMSWTYSAKDQILLPNISFKSLVNGITGESIIITQPDDVGNGFNVPGLQIPPIPLLAFPSAFAGAGTGSSCCDALAALMGGVYTCVLTVGSIAPNQDSPAERVVAFDFASNQQMYDAATAHINFINTGTITYTVDVEGTATVTTYSAPAPHSVTSQIRYNGVQDDTYPISLHTMSSVGKFLGYSEDFITSLTIDQSTNFPPQFLFRSPNFIEIIVSNHGSVSTFNVTFTNMRVTIRGTP